MTDTPTIAFLGTGLMGLPMAENLARAGYAVSAWNRTAEKAQPLASLGAVVCDTAVEAVRGADVVIAMLSDGAVGLLMIAETAHVLREGALWIDMSSTKPAEAREQAAGLTGRGCPHLDAPVSGGTQGAKDGTLAIMVGGPVAVYDMAVPVLQALGRPVHVGPSGAGQLAKLANQTIVAITIGAVAEAMMLLEEGGADPAAVRDALRGGFADSTILQQHGARMTERRFEPGGLVTAQIKDIDNALEEAANRGLTLPMAQDVRARFARLRDELNGGALDHSALYLELRDRQA